MDQRTPIGGLPHIDRLVATGEPEYTPAEVAAAAGVGLDDARRLWRAMGFADLADDDRALSHVDLDMLRAVAAVFESGVADRDLVLQMARVMGHALGRVAGAQAAAIRERMEAVVDSSTAPEVETSTAVESIDWVIELLESFLVYLWRRHLLSAGARDAARDDDSQTPGELAVGFADLVGFTAMSDEYAGSGLVDVIERFEDVSFDVVMKHGARVVKTIGDEVMFVAEDPAAATRAGAALAEACASDPELPDVRVGLAHGPTLTVSGDYFGPAVNLASRLVAIANPGSVVASESLRQVVGDTDEIAWGLPRARRVKGVGRVLMWVVRRPDHAEHSWLGRLAGTLR